MPTEKRSNTLMVMRSPILFGLRLAAMGRNHAAVRRASWYWSDVSRPSSVDSIDGRTANSQPAPNGSSTISRGMVTAAELVIVTRPLTGARMVTGVEAEVHNAAHGIPTFTKLRTGGRSTATMSSPSKASGVVPVRCGVSPGEPTAGASQLCVSVKSRPCGISDVVTIFLSCRRGASWWSVALGLNYAGVIGI